MTDNSIFINGPVNAIRLEGNIDDMQKVIYLFGDYHIPVENQTQCPSFLSDDFVRYLAKTIKKSDKNTNYDLFFEVGPSFSKDPIIKTRGKYIDEVYKFFRANIKIKKTTDSIENKNNTSPTNLRLHYIDIRDFIKTNVNINFAAINDTLNTCMYKQHINVSVANSIIQSTQNIKTEINFIINCFEKIDQLEDIKRPDIENIVIHSADKNTISNVTLYLLKKIFSKYDNKSIQETLIKKTFIISEIITRMKHIDDDLDKIVAKLYDFNNSYVKSNVLNKAPDGYFIYGTSLEIVMDLIKELYDMVNKSYVSAISAYSFIIDLYFMRRFLDKKYITNGIVYTGISHSVTYTYLLVKYFDFKVTHASYCKLEIDELNNYIKDNEYTKDCDELFFPKIFSQCVDMGHFPKFFK